MKITIYDQVKNPKVYIHGASDRKLQEYGADVKIK